MPSGHSKTSILLFMLNPDFSIFNDNMFIQTRQLLDGLPLNTDKPIIDLTIGEPKMPPPSWLNEVLISVSTNWQSYPKPAADDQFLDDLAVYFKQRFPAIAGKFDLQNHIVPVPGTREPLHLIGYCVKGAKPNSIAYIPNPFYHAWRAGALAAGGEIGYLNAFEKTGFLPDLDNIDHALLQRCTILYLCNPTNPQGIIARKDYIEKAILLARHYHFLLVIDECYIDIWREEKPISALEIAYEMGGENCFSHLLVLNSLSKRSNAAGLRAGFLCGAEEVIAAYKLLVANGAAPVPTPLLHLAGALYRDAEHNQLICAHYSRSFQILAEHFPVTIPHGGFFLWMATPHSFDGDDRLFAKYLYTQAGIKTVPGSFMAKSTNEGNPASGFIRIAVVHDHDIIRSVALRISELLDNL